MTYDLSGFAGALATVNQMAADQRSGAIKFAGGSVTWLDNPSGKFTAIVAVGGSALPTTTNNVRALLTTLRATFDVLAASPGAASENIAILAAVPPIALQAGFSRANGPIVDGGGTVQQTAYDLSGIGALQTTANQMVSDQLAGGTQFITGTFPAIFEPGGPTLQSTMSDVRGRLARLRVVFDQLAQ